MQSAVIFACVVGLAFGCDYPDNTQTKLYAKSCSATDKIQPLNISVVDAQGNNNYPIDLSKPITVVALSQNNYGAVNKLLASVTLEGWSTWFCTWITIPTFGLLNNLDGCSIGHNCPLAPGPLTLRQSVDISQYASILKGLTSNAPYRLTIKLQENDDAAKTEVSCISVEARIKH